PWVHPVESRGRIIAPGWVGVGWSAASAAEQLPDGLHVGLGDVAGAFQTARHAARLPLHQVPAAGPLTTQPATAGDLDPLGGTAVRLLLRHEISSLLMADRHRHTGDGVGSALVTALSGRFLGGLGVLGLFALLLLD